jgi:hypothetical protein
MTLEENTPGFGEFDLETKDGVILLTPEAEEKPESPAQPWEEAWKPKTMEEMLRDEELKNLYRSEEDLFLAMAASGLGRMMPDGREAEELAKAKSTGWRCRGG